MLDNWQEKIGKQDHATFKITAYYFTKRPIGVLNKMGNTLFFNCTEAIKLQDHTTRFSVDPGCGPCCSTNCILCVESTGLTLLELLVAVRF